MDFQIRFAKSDDEQAIRDLLPLLAQFEVPPLRNPEHLWRGDEAMFDRWLAGEDPELFVLCAYDQNDLLGVAMVRMREEMLSHAPSAHLEVIVSAQLAQGRGIAQALLDSAETEAQSRGAKSMTLHVFANNQRARRFYDKSGFEGEIVRYIKHFPQD